MSEIMNEAAVRHPVREGGGSANHVKAFEAIAIGLTPRCQPATLSWLVEHGLVERLPDKTIGRDRFGAIAIPQYHVPLLMHKLWCDWCAEQD